MPEMGEILLSSNSTLNTLERKPKEKENETLSLQIEVVVFRARAFKFFVTGAETDLVDQSHPIGSLDFYKDAQWGKGSLLCLFSSHLLL
jgi:hypothetical protein